MVGEVADYLIIRQPIARLQTEDGPRGEDRRPVDVPVVIIYAAANPARPLLTVRSHDRLLHVRRPADLSGFGNGGSH